MPLDGLSQDVEQFQLPIYFSIIAHFTFGVTGALAALRRGYDFIGVLFLAMITAGGGGLIRDGLISQGPPAFLTHAHLISTVLIAAIVTAFLHRYVNRVARVIAIIDALGLGAFAVTGVQVGSNAGLNVPAAIICGTITAVGGGLLRDVLVREEPLLFKPGQYYALVAIAGCCLFVTLLHFGWLGPRHAAIVTILAVFSTRLLAIRFNWQTRALYRAPQPPA